MITSKRLTVHMDDENLDFLKKLAKRDGVSIQEELAMIFWCEFDHCKELYEDELDAE